MSDNRFRKKIKPTLCPLAAAVGLMSLFISNTEAQVFGSFGSNPQNNPLAAPTRQAAQPKPAIRQPQPAASITTSLPTNRICTTPLSGFHSSGS